MDTLEHYREIICAVLTEHTKIRYSFGDIHHETLFDRAQDRYAVIILE